MIVLENVRSMPVKRTAGKIKDHLSDIYREYFRNNELELIFGGEELTFKEIGYILEVSESRVSQVHTKAILRMRSRLKNSKLQFEGKDRDRS